MSIILGIDPGSERSAWVLYDLKAHEVKLSRYSANWEMLLWFEHCDIKSKFDHCAIEMIASYGMPVGKSVFDTCLWIGQFIIRVLDKDISVSLVPKKTKWTSAFNYGANCQHEGVNMFLCNSNRAKDSNIRQAIIDRFSPTGGGKIPQIGTKKKPGPLYGISGDVWSALAVAITCGEQGQT